MFTEPQYNSGLNNLALPSFGLNMAISFAMQNRFCITKCIRKSLPVYILYYRAYTPEICGKLPQLSQSQSFVATCYKTEREDYVKREDKKVMSFRFEDPIIEKIDYLVDQDKENMEKLGLKPKTRKQIIEEAIRDYYLRKINDNMDPDTMDQIALMIDDAADVRFNKFKRTIDEILFLVIKNDLANKILLNSEGVPEPHPLDNYAMSEIAKKECRWNRLLQDYMTSNWMRFMAEIHNPKRFSR